jgi:hypothetical protein
MSIRLTAFATLCLACLSAAVSAAASPPAQVTREEVIDEVARFTGLSKDSVSLAASENPKLFEGLDQCVLAVKVVNQFAEAKDAEGLIEIGSWLLGKVKDRLIPAGAGALLTAVSVYKSALEAVRDYAFTPAFESSLYRKYSRARREDAQRGDASRESLTTAFETATTAWFSGYPALKQRMFDRMVKAKGYNREVMGPQLERELWRKIDDYWIACFEAKFQQELLRENRIGIIAKLWSAEGRKLAALRGKGAGRDAREAFFITDKDLPAGWKLRRSKLSDGLQTERNPAWQHIGQSFSLRSGSLVEKYFPDGKSIRYYTSPGRSTDVIYNLVTIRIYPSAQRLPNGTLWRYRDSLREQLARNESRTFAGAKILRPFEEAGVDAGLLAYDGSRSHDVEWSIAFAKGDYYAEVEFGGAPPAEIERRRAVEVQRSPNPRSRTLVADSPVSEEMALYFARLVASKMPAPR